MIGRQIIRKSFSVLKITKLSKVMVNVPINETTASEPEIVTSMCLFLLQMLTSFLSYIYIYIHSLSLNIQ